MINYKITSKNYELIRNAIGAILTAEFARQVANFYNEDCEDVRFFVERNTPVDKTELSAVTISMWKGSFDKHYQGGMDGHYKIAIQVFTRAKSTLSQRGDALSAYKNQRIMGICIAILGDPIYKTLGFDPGFIESVKVDSFQQIDSPQKEDDLNIISGAVILDVDAAESVELPDGVPFQTNVTNVTLSPSEYGLEFIYTP